MTTLPIDSAARKQIPLNAGLLMYFPAALAGVAKCSREGNDKHNPGEPLHHAREKSSDHREAILRHLLDLNDWIAAGERDGLADVPEYSAGILAEADAIAWRALALSQELHECHAGAPLAPGARLDCRGWDELRAQDNARAIAEPPPQ